VIVTPFLDGYISMSEFIKDEQYDLSPEEALFIYQKIVDVKNAMTQLCLNHSDLHKGNIMILPTTKDIKVIDLGLCKTPEEERLDDYSDSIRLIYLKRNLINKAALNLENQMDKILLLTANPNCVRRKSVWKIRNGEEFDAQVNHLIDRIENKTRKDEIEELFKNLFEFIGMNESWMSTPTKLQILNEINRQKIRFPEVNKFKKNLGGEEEQEERGQKERGQKERGQKERGQKERGQKERGQKGEEQEEEPEEGEITVPIVLNQQEWIKELKRLVEIQNRERSIDSMKTILDFMILNDPKYIHDKILSATIINVGKNYPTVFEKYLEALGKIQKSREYQHEH
jgi:hypothetical protein